MPSITTLQRVLCESSTNTQQELYFDLHRILLQHCDKVIPLEYSVKAKEKTKTIFSRVIINSDKVDLVMREETKTWTLFMDRSGVSVCAMYNFFV